MYVIQYRIKVANAWDEWQDDTFSESARAIKFLYMLNTDVLGDDMYEYQIIRRAEGLEEVVSLEDLEFRAEEEE